MVCDWLVANSIPRSGDELPLPSSKARERSRLGGLFGPAMIVLALAAIGGLFGCEPKLVVGTRTRTCSADAAVEETSDPVVVPWSSSFENQFCDYAPPTGYCYTAPLASYRTVTSPVHSGTHAAAFTVDSADPASQQTRCVRQGTLPHAAYYGAWYFIPATATNADLWNLIHIMKTDPVPEPGLWDVSLENGSDGDLRLVVYDHLSATKRRPATPVPVPIGAWFHIQFYLVRAAGPTGEVALYQDGELLFDQTNIVTDDSSVGQWYVGNLATDLTPSESTLYVDDVSISATL